MGQRPWFRRRTFGLGWTPITWEGWLVTAGGLGLALAVDALVLGRLPK